MLPVAFADPDTTLSQRNSSNPKRHHHTHNSFLTTSGGVVKRTNRHLAALDFLLHIPLEKEQQIKETGKRNLNKIQFLERRINQDSPDDDIEQSHSEQMIVTVEDIPGQMEESAVGYKRLQGIKCPIARIPSSFRYSFLSRGDQTALVKHWEVELLGRNAATPADTSSPEPQSILSSRLFFSRNNSYPSALLSVIKYDAGREASNMHRQRAADMKGVEVFALLPRDWRGLSYRPLFKPLTEEDTAAGDYFLRRGFLHDPDGLDDPSMLYGIYRHISSRGERCTGPIVSSIIAYVNKADLKANLNQRFRETHPQLPPSLTLSKIRSLKKQVAIGCDLMDLELATAAYALIYFERLCLKGLVAKTNRRLALSVCLLLAAKFNENVTLRHRDRLTRLLEFCDSEWAVPRSEVFAAEFGAFVHLGFSLHVPRQHVHLMYTRLLRLLHRSSREYLREDMEAMYSHTLASLESGPLSAAPTAVVEPPGT